MGRFMRAGQAVWSQSLGLCRTALSQGLQQESSSKEHCGWGTAARRCQSYRSVRGAVSGPGANFLCCHGWDSFSLRALALSHLSGLSSFSQGMIFEARTLSVNERCSKVGLSNPMLSYFSWKVLRLAGIQVFSLEDEQLNYSSLNYVLKACRECRGSSSGRCQGQRWRKGPENWVILKSSGTVWLVMVKIANGI